MLREFAFLLLFFERWAPSSTTAPKKYEILATICGVCVELALPLFVPCARQQLADIGANLPLTPLRMGRALSFHYKYTHTHVHRQISNYACGVCWFLFTRHEQFVCRCNCCCCTVFCTHLCLFGNYHSFSPVKRRGLHVYAQSICLFDFGGSSSQRIFYLIYPQLASIKCRLSRTRYNFMCLTHRSRIIVAQNLVQRSSCTPSHVWLMHFEADFTFPFHVNSTEHDSTIWSKLDLIGCLAVI